MALDRTETETPKCLAFASRFVVDETDDGDAERVTLRREVLSSLPIVDFDEAQVADLVEHLLGLSIVKTAILL